MANRLRHQTAAGRLGRWWPAERVTAAFSFAWTRTNGRELRGQLAPQMLACRTGGAAGGVADSSSPAHWRVVPDRPARGSHSGTTVRAILRSGRSGVRKATRRYRKLPAMAPGTGDCAMLRRLLQFSKFSAIPCVPVMPKRLETQVDQESRQTEARSQRRQESSRPSGSSEAWLMPELNEPGGFFAFRPRTIKSRKSSDRRCRQLRSGAAGCRA